MSQGQDFWCCIQQYNRNLEWQESSPLTILDNQGSFDALMCGVQGDSAEKMMKEMTRVCKDSGHVIIISFGEPTNANPTSKEV